MKRKIIGKLFFFLVYQTCFLAWCFKIHTYAFEFTLADKIGLVLAAAFPITLISIKFPKWTNGLIVLLFVIPVGIYPLINQLRLFYADMWVLIYVSLLITGIAALANSNLKYFSIGFVASVWFIGYEFLPNQKHYFDRLTSTHNTRKGAIDLVEWKGDRWIYYNQSLVISTADGHMHAETLVHTTLPRFSKPNVLLLGGDHGLTSKEIRKYTPNFIHIPYDAEFAGMATPTIQEFIKKDTSLFEVIILDLPDAENVEFVQYYSREFFEILSNKISSNGLIITNAGSPHSYQTVENTLIDQLSSLGLYTQLLEMHIPTLGQRAWIIGSTHKINWERIDIRVETQWINEEGIKLLLNNGKRVYPFALK